MSSKKSKISLKSLKFEFLGHSHHRKQCRFEQAHFHHRHEKKSARVEFKNHGNDLDPAGGDSAGRIGGGRAGGRGKAVG